MRIVTSLIVTHWPSTELSVKICTWVNNRCIRSKLTGYHLDLWTGWIRCNCDAHRKQVDDKQLYNRVPQTAWVSCSSSCSSRELTPDRGLGPSVPRLSSPAEWGRSAGIDRGTGGQYVVVCYVSNSPLTHNQYQPCCNPFATLSKIKCERYIFLKNCVRSFIIVDYVSACICIRIVVSWLYNIIPLQRYNKNHIQSVYSVIRWKLKPG